MQDELGSPIRIIGEAGNTKGIYSYDAFGRPIIPVNLISKCKTRGNIYSYTGYQYDLSTGLMYAQARYYLPEVGRFISEDAYKGTVAEPQSLNWYAYCRNNPVNYVDPMGKDPSPTSGTYKTVDISEYLKDYGIDKGVSGDILFWNTYTSCEGTSSVGYMITMKFEDSFDGGVAASKFKAEQNKSFERCVSNIMTVTGGATSFYGGKVATEVGKRLLGYAGTALVALGVVKDNSDILPDVSFEIKAGYQIIIIEETTRIGYSSPTLKETLTIRDKDGNIVEHIASIT